jgi:midasin
VLIRVQDVPYDELSQILVQKSGLPESRAEMMLKCMTALQMYRSSNNNIFSGKDQMITVRDLLKWADRIKAADARGLGMNADQIAQEGFLILGERSRNAKDKQFIRDTICKTLKTKVDPEKYYEDYYQQHGFDSLLSGLVHTKQLKRLAVLLHKCLSNNEPVLLVGETGCGKTSLCQAFAALFKQQLHSINCHQNTDTSDFIGCMRTRKNLEQVQDKIKEILEAHDRDTSNL